MHGELEVHWGPQRIGYLFDNALSGWSFVYDPVKDIRQDAQGSAMKRVLSMNLPPRDEPYRGADVSAFFRNLLPDGSIRRQLGHQLGLTEGNDFALIGSVCEETFGALKIHRPDSSALEAGDVRVLNERDLRNLVAALPLSPLLTEIQGYRSVLPGANHKITVQLVDDQFALPLGSELSTHIIKPAREGLRESVYNEGFCMALARQMGLPAVETQLRQGPATVLVCERFDRQMTAQGITAIHAEDFCQLNLLPPERTFEREGGLSAAECVQLLRKYSVCPAPDIRILLKWLIFNFLIGNGHATAKQLALVHTSRGPRLAPLYGLRSTHIYPHLNQDLAMRIGGEDRPDWLIPDRWREFARDAEIRPSYVLELFEQLAIEIPRACGELADGWQQKHGFMSICAPIRRLIERRSRQILVSFQAEAG